MRLGILDQSPVPTGTAPAAALAESVELARLAESWGYHRYWVAEHHNLPGLAGSAPEIMVGRLAAATRRIRVGSGGVMLPNYSALKVAEQFRTLEALFPGRIDLGIGRAPGGDRLTSFALTGHLGGGEDDFPQRFAHLLHYLGGGGLEAAGHGRVAATPQIEGAPEVWMLGSSGGGARFASAHGTRFAFAQFIAERSGDGVMARYRSEFRPSEHEAKPVGAVCVTALAAPTLEEAEHLASSRDLWRLRRDQGEIGPIPSIEEAEAYPYTPAERERVTESRRWQAIGTPEMVRAGLEEIADRYGAEEIMVLTLCHDPMARRRSYRLIAEAFGLRGESAAA